MAAATKTLSIHQKLHLLEAVGIISRCKLENAASLPVNFSFKFLNENYYRGVSCSSTDAVEKAKEKALISLEYTLSKSDKYTSILKTIAHVYAGEMVPVQMEIGHSATEPVDTMSLEFSIGSIDFKIWTSGGWVCG